MLHVMQREVHTCIYIYNHYYSIISINIFLSCDLAPVYLAFDLALAFIIIVIFDSGIYLLLDIASRDFQLHGANDAAFKLRDIQGATNADGIPVGISVRRAFRNWGPTRIAKTNLIHGFFFMLSASIKVLVQVALTKFVWREFLWYWDDVNMGCNQSHDEGGIFLGGSETAMQVLGSFASYIIFFFLFCALTNTFIW